MLIFELLTHEVPALIFKLVKNGLYRKDIEVLIVNFLLVMPREKISLKGGSQDLKSLGSEKRVALEQILAVDYFV